MRTHKMLHAPEPTLSSLRTLKLLLAVGVCCVETWPAHLARRHGAEHMPVSIVREPACSCDALLVPLS